MKTKLQFLLMAIMLNACTSTAVVEPTEYHAACGVNDPAKNLPWLKDLIGKAEADKSTGAYKGNYIGQIYQTTWRNQDAFWTNFMMGSGGIYARLYACDGHQIILNSMDPSATEIEEMNKTINKDKLIYTNMPL